jgi:hypothetical protein
MAVGGLTKVVKFIRCLTAEKGGIIGVGIDGYFVASVLYLHSLVNKAWEFFHTFAAD